MIEKLTELGLYPKVSFNKFKQRFDYNRHIKIVCAYTHSKENMFIYYADFGSTKVFALKNAYAEYLKLLNNESSELVWTNRGLPLSRKW
jgi:hypothetical protein